MQETKESKRSSSFRPLSLFIYPLDAIEALLLTESPVRVAVTSAIQSDVGTDSFTVDDEKDVFNNHKFQSI